MYVRNIELIYHMLKIVHKTQYLYKPDCINMCIIRSEDKTLTLNFNPFETKRIIAFQRLSVQCNSFINGVMGLRELVGLEILFERHICFQRTNQNK